MTSKISAENPAQFWLRISQLWKQEDEERDLSDLICKNDFDGQFDDDLDNIKL